MEKEPRNYSRFSPEQIRAARQVDLGEYLLSVGAPLVRAGRRWRHKEHDSLVFTGNAYQWNSQGRHGNAIDYLRLEMSMAFSEAMAELLSFAQADARPAHNAGSAEEKPLEFSKRFEAASDMRRVIAYLTKSRSIDYGIVKEMIDRKLLFQEAKTNNAVFLVRDGQGEAVGAEVRGTLDKIAFKGIAEGSLPGYGFNVLIGECPQYALFFESAIDLMSFMDCKRMIGKSLSNCLLVSLAGLKIHTLERTLGRISGKPEVFLCVDNDEAGGNFIKSVLSRNQAARTHLPSPQFKDWNEMLAAVKSARQNG
jgi:hypothetical protein